MITTQERLIACGEQCVKIGLFKEAIEGWTAAGDTARLASLGSHLFDTNNYQLATECFKAAGEPMKMFLSAQCDFVHGRYDAINDMALLGEAPTHSQFLQCGNCAWRLQKWQHAIFAFASVNESDKLMSLTDSLMKSTQDARVKYPLAIDAFKTVGAFRCLIRLGDALANSESSRWAICAYAAAGVAVVPISKLVSCATQQRNRGHDKYEMEALLLVAAKEDICNAFRLKSARMESLSCEEATKVLVHSTRCEACLEWVIQEYDKYSAARGISEMIIHKHPSETIAK